MENLTSNIIETKNLFQPSIEDTNVGILIITLLAIYNLCSYLRRIVIDRLITQEFNEWEIKTLTISYLENMPAGRKMKKREELEKQIKDFSNLKLIKGLIGWDSAF